MRPVSTFALRNRREASASEVRRSATSSKTGVLAERVGISYQVWHRHSDVGRHIVDPHPTRQSRRKPVTQVLTKLFYKPAECAPLLSMGRTKVQEAIASGELRSVLRGRARLVPAAALLEFAERLASGETDE